MGSVRPTGAKGAIASPQTIGTAASIEASASGTLASAAFASVGVLASAPPSVVVHALAIKSSETIRMLEHFARASRARKSGVRTRSNHIIFDVQTCLLYTSPSPRD